MSTTILDHAFAVILAGGSGTRLWPKSRDNTPKQFLKLGGKRTMMQLAVDRILPLIPYERVIVVTNARYHEDVRAQLPELPEANIISEPERRDTAMAMALGSLIARHRDPDAVVINLASDHVVTNINEYRKVITTALGVAAKKESLLTVGIQPTSPNVNFGYIKVDGVKEDASGYPIYAVHSFKEKPDSETAKVFLNEGNYYWNANMYTWHVETILDAFRQHYPESMPGLERLIAVIDTPEFLPTLSEVYASAQKVSIDVAISEKAQNLILIPGDFGWDDVGLWNTVYELGEKNANETVVVAEGDDNSPVLEMEAKRNLIGTNHRMVALLGVEDMVVIDSKDIVFVAPRDRAAEVKKIVQQLEAEGQTQYL